MTTIEAASRSQLPRVLVALFRGIVQREQSAERWRDLVGLQAAARDYVRVLGLDLIIDEAEGYAFLRQSDDQGPGAVAGAGTDADGCGEGTKAATPSDTEPLPRLIARRQLSYPVSLLLVLLRKRLAQHDALGGDTRLMLSRDQLIEMMRTFLPGSTNDAKLADQIGRHVDRVEELGFLRKTQEGELYEVRRILRAFVDADWLAELEAIYRAHAEQPE